MPPAGDRAPPSAAGGSPNAPRCPLGRTPRASPSGQALRESLPRGARALREVGTHRACSLEPGAFRFTPDPRTLPCASCFPSSSSLHSPPPQPPRSSHSASGTAVGRRCGSAGDGRRRGSAPSIAAAPPARAPFENEPGRAAPPAGSRSPPATSGSALRAAGSASASDPPPEGASRSPAAGSGRRAPSGRVTEAESAPPRSIPSGAPWGRSPLMAARRAQVSLSPPRAPA